MTTKLAVVAYPVLEDADREWIEAIRRRHDPQTRLIGPHFTLVFPVLADQEPVVAHVSTVCACTPRLPISASEVRAVREGASRGGHVFLVPSSGSEIVELHDRLYDGMPRAALRADLPYIPHITIGADSDFEVCERLALRLRGEARSIRAVLDRVDVIEVHADRVESIACLPLVG